MLLMTEKEILQLGNIMPTATRDNPNQGRVYSIKGISPTITDVSGGGGQTAHDCDRKQNPKVDAA